MTHGLLDPSAFPDMLWQEQFAASLEVGGFKQVTSDGYLLFRVC